MSGELADCLATAVSGVGCEALDEDTSAYICGMLEEAETPADSMDDVIDFLESGGEISAEQAITVFEEMLKHLESKQGPDAEEAPVKMLSTAVQLQQATAAVPVLDVVLPAAAEAQCGVSASDLGDQSKASGEQDGEQARGGHDELGEGSDDEAWELEAGAASVCFDNWQSELKPKLLEEWTATEVAAFVVQSALRHKREDIMNKVAVVIEQESMCGALLVASGAAQLEDLVLPHIRKKDKPNVKGVIRYIFDCLDQHSALQQVAQRIAGREASYWDRMELEGTDEEQHICQVFSGSKVGGVLVQLLTPQEQAAVLYCFLEGLPQIDVKFVDNYVSKVRSVRHHFKVISVSSADNPELVQQNMIYRGTAGKWELMVSVDFVWHGSAAPGHWHVNRTPDGTLIEHWGPNMQVWHGDFRCCPKWWHLIPKGTRHAEQVG